MRRVSGYNLDEFVEGAGYTGPIGGRNAGPRPWNLAHLIAGSEGTLACLLEATVRLTPLPKATALAIVHFDNEIDSLRHVPRSCARAQRHRVAGRPGAARVAAERIDARFGNVHRGAAQAVLLVEVFGEDQDDANQRIAALVADLQTQRIGYAWPMRSDAKGQADVWNVRKLGLGLISNVQGPVKGQAFVEDACVPVEVLAEYIERLQQVCRELGCADHHVRSRQCRRDPFPPDPGSASRGPPPEDGADRQPAFEMVCQYGGVFAGEHGDGLVRGEFIPRYYGPQLYEAFRQVKGLFDPAGLMNPGKIVDSPSMVSHLRYGDALPHDRCAGPFPLPGTRRFPVGGRAVQRRGRLPQTGRRHDVPQLHGDQRRRGDHSRARQHVAVGDDRAIRAPNPGQRPSQSRCSNCAWPAKRARPSVPTRSTCRG
jgi:hypothetical protein